MKTDNLNQPGERTHGVVRGHVGRGRAGTPGQTYRDALTTATEIVDLTFVGGTLTDNDDGTAVFTMSAGTGYTQAEADDLFLTRRDGEGHVVATTAASGAAVTLDVSAANVFDITLTANCTFTISNPPAAGVAGKIIVILRQGGVGSFTVTWPGSVDWQDTDGTTGGAAPTLFTAVGAQDDIELATLDGGVTWGGQRSVQGTSFGTPAIVLGTAAAAGSASTAVRTDATIVAFDATVPTTQAFGDAAATGAAAVAARRDHKHAMPANPVTEAAVQAVGHYEVLMDGSGTATPLENGSGSDWLWVWVV